MFQSTEKLSAKMMSRETFFLVVTLVAAAVIAVHGEEDATPTEKPGFADAAKEKWQQGVEAAKSGIASAGAAYDKAKEKVGPMASNFTDSVKEKWNEGVQKVSDLFSSAKKTISSHVSPIVNKVRTGMLDGVRNLREKLHKKDKEGGEGPKEDDAGEKAAAKAEINSGEDGA